MNETPGARDHRRVRELLGREPRGAYEIVVRDDDGDPVVLRNAPLLDDGTPMPTRYWLIGADEARRIGQLEAAGGVDRAEAAVDPAELADAHDRYAAERDADLPADHTGPRPTGGVGGTRVGVKCLHAHWAWHLAGGDDPIGRWIEDRLADAATPAPVAADPTITLHGRRTTVQFDDARFEFPWGPDNLTERWLDDHDPPRPDELTNALGIVTDHLDDLIRIHPGVVDVREWALDGAGIGALASLEIGATVSGRDHELDRPTAEEVFRLVATEPARDRAHNPGLPSDAVETIVATCCIVQATMRRLHLDRVTLRVPADAG
ncbi:MAG: DUF501 domain-containing protein [Ilumatobacter sp.]|nr:DUF501 domain-containing protein [Ilumatobacter sp.]